MLQRSIAIFMVCLAFSLSAQAEEDWLYSVRPGDTLWDLCLTYTVKKDCWLKLGDYNNVIYPRRLPPGLIIHFPVSWLREAPTPVRLVFFTGDVRYQSQPTEPFVAVTEGASFTLGATIKTGPESVAGLQFGDGSLMRLEPNTTIVLDSMSVANAEGRVDTRVRLPTGAVQTRVPERVPKSRFQISTPAAIAAVRGTEFRVTAKQSEAGNELMLGEVYEGVVAVTGDAAESSADVAAGFGIAAAAGQELQTPTPLPPAPKWKKIADNQFPPLTLAWRSLADIDNYRLEIHQRQEQADALLAVVDSQESGFTDTGFKFIEGCYQLVVRAVSSAGLIGLPSTTEVCINGQLATPERDQATLKFDANADQLALNWQPVPLAEGYQLQISNSPEFDTVAYTFTTQQPEYTLALDEGVKTGFYYRVQALSSLRTDSQFSAVTKASSEPEPLLALSLWAIVWVLVGAF
ncbi:FecR domain-containing protein [Halioxenophilus sp. WMMB6]|uniref:FecR domain-containing protein n=1 Tax=Halioxenophilus sp. WMMB6 TaxID=3073815 RepID=UPI00295E8888|nr:FecR domain-containing protein [Halioxenophilus sp. WMMB6]